MKKANSKRESRREQWRRHEWETCTQNVREKGERGECEIQKYMRQKESTREGVEEGERQGYK